MEKLSVILLIIIVFGCSEKKFVRSEVLAQFSKDTIYYEAYQTGVDNYQVEFKSKSGNNVEHLFNYHINDGILTKTTLRSIVSGDSVLILSKHIVENQSVRTRQGIYVSMRKS